MKEKQYVITSSRLTPSHHKSFLVIQASVHGHVPIQRYKDGT